MKDIKINPASLKVMIQLEFKQLLHDKPKQVEREIPQNKQKRHLNLRRQANGEEVVKLVSTSQLEDKFMMGIVNPISSYTVHKEEVELDENKYT